MPVSGMDTEWHSFDFKSPILLSYILWLRDGILPMDCLHNRENHCELLPDVLERRGAHKASSSQLQHGSRGSVQYFLLVQCILFPPTRFGGCIMSHGGMVTTRTGCHYSRHPLWHLPGLYERTEYQVL